MILGLATWAVASPLVAGDAEAWPHSDLEVVDVDADGRAEIVTCSDQGVTIEAWGPLGSVPSVLSRVPCTALAVRPDGLWVQETGWRYWSLPGPIGRGEIPAGPPAALPLAVQIIEGRLVGVDGPLRTFAGIGQVTQGDVDGDGSVDWIVTHPGAGLVGWISADGVERSVQVPIASAHVGAGDLDGDGAAEVIVGDGLQRVVLLHAPAPPALPVAPPSEPPEEPETPIEASPVDRERLALATTRVMGLKIPEFAGTEGTLASRRRPSTVQATGGVGLAMGSSLSPGRGIGGFVAFAAAMEHETSFGRLWYGVDSAPLFLQAGESVVWHIGMVSSGLTWGGPHLRAGPYVTAGLLGLGSGWRTLFTPFETASGSVHGFETRITGFVGPSNDGPILWSQPTGEIMLLYASTFQLGRTMGRFDAVVPPPRPTGRPARAGRRVGASRFRPGPRSALRRPSCRGSS